MDVRNIFSKIPERVPDEELSEEIITADHCKIERIVSEGHSSPSKGWYDQEENEWVMVLSGRAGLRFEGKDEVIVMESGDHIHIPAHQKHRVEWTAPDQKTIWLAVHYRQIRPVRSSAFRRSVSRP